MELETTIADYAAYLELSPHEFARRIRMALSITDDVQDVVFTKRGWPVWTWISPLDGVETRYSLAEYAFSDGVRFHAAYARVERVLFLMDERAS